jgi:tetracycline resistance efflux pump
MLNTWFVLFPPLCILVATLITKRLNASLILGLITAAAIATQLSPSATISLLAKRIFGQLADLETIYFYAFLILLGIIISLFEYTGAATAFAQKLTKRLTNAKQTQTSALLLSATLFIDDYLSCLTTGYVMRPLTDRFAIPRVKLAFLIHSLSGPLVILAPISSWIALITSQLENAGVSTASATSKVLADPFYIYLNAIPYIFYSIILIISVWFIVRMQISFGPMHTHEVIAQETGNLYGGKAPIHAPSALAHQNGSLWDLVIPLLVLITCFVASIAWLGGYYLFGGHYSFLQALQKNSQTGLALFIAGVITLAVTLLIGYCRKTITLESLKPIALNGFTMMQSSIVMVFLASIFGTMLREDLQTGAYLAQLLQGSISIALLPVIFYGISIITALITGSAWGTIALMVPIAIQMITTLLAATLPVQPADILILFPVLGAIFSGAVCGNHISPIAETTIMSATSASCYPLDHAYTQFWYALPAILAAGVSFICCGLFMTYPPLINLTLSGMIGILLCLGSLFVANKMLK